MKPKYPQGQGGGLAGTLTVQSCLLRCLLRALAMQLGMPPYILVVEAKRGVEGRSPVAQLLGGLLCAGWHNHQKRPQAEQVLYGAYTVADVWTFLQVTLTQLDSEQPRMRIVSSRGYAETSEAATIVVLLLKSMVSELLRAQAG